MLDEAKLIERANTVARNLAAFTAGMTAAEYALMLPNVIFKMLFNTALESRQKAFKDVATLANGRAEMWRGYSHSTTLNGRFSAREEEASVIFEWARAMSNVGSFL